MEDFAILTRPYPLTQNQIIQYQQDGYIKLKDVLDESVLAAYGALIAQLVEKYNQQDVPLAQRGTYGKAFLQITNLWEIEESVRPFCLSTRLGRIAAELMRVDGVRMYHDQALFKEPSGGYTPWHADQFYWPLSSSNTVTAWIPLQATPLEMGPLQFCIGSHNLLEHRGLAISDDSEARIGRSLRNYPQDETAYDLGEVSFHSGWVFHRAGPNNTDQMRGVMTIIYMEDGIKAIEPKYDAHKADLARWLPGVRPGSVASSHLNPVIYHRDAARITAYSAT